MARKKGQRWPSDYQAKRPRCTLCGERLDRDDMIWDTRVVATGEGEEIKETGWFCGPTECLWDDGADFDEWDSAYEAELRSHFRAAQCP